MAGRPFTISGLITITLLVVVGTAVLVPIVSSNRRLDRQLKDQTQVEAIMRGFVSFASNSNATYPLPSQLDMSNRVVPESGTHGN